MERSIAFYHDVLTFEKVADHEFTDPAFDSLEGLFDVRVRVVDMKLGDETLRLTQYLTAGGKPVPMDSHCNDRWFQHIAIVVRDMDAAFAKLEARHVLLVSAEPITLPASNVPAAGIRATYFRDPDNHALELIYFPKGKGMPKWQERPGKGVFLGIDHTAIGVADSEASLKFYRDQLGFEVKGTADNFGTEQEHLNRVAGCRVHITGLRLPQGPGIEFLQYVTPTDGRPYPADEQANDLIHWQTVIFCESDADLTKAPTDISKLPLGGTKAALVRDPDGHAMQLTER
jgi:catechol 2,3-dioxygenase-like lactoylglutathione lyase family enzyme